MENKYVFAKELDIGQKVEGYKYDTKSSFFTGYIKEITPSYIAVAKWRPDGIIEKYPPDALFSIPYPRNEYKQKYKESASKIVDARQNNLQRYEIGYHEMANGWLSPDPYEMAEYCEKNGYMVIGICKDIIPKPISDDYILDVGVCCEYEDGEKFWCHFNMDTIETMILKFKEVEREAINYEEER